MEDIRNTCAVVNKTAGEIGMTEADRQKCNDLLERYGDERADLMEQMLSLLGNFDRLDIEDSWTSCCEKGENLIEKLNGEIPRTRVGDGLAGIGAGDFHSGETKAWEKCASAEIASKADLLAKIYAADVEVIKKCGEDLKTIADGNKQIEARVQENNKSLLEKAKSLAFEFSTNFAAGYLIDKFLVPGSSQDLAGSNSEFTLNLLSKNIEEAKAKDEIRKLLLENMELINNAQDKLSEDWIDEVYENSQDDVETLLGIAQYGSNKAVDWAKFGINCIDHLSKRRDRSKEQSKKVFNELLPTFVEANKTRFATLTNEPAVLEEWKSKMAESYSSIEDVLNKQDDVINNLADGPFKQGVKETVSSIRQIFGATKEMVFTKTKEAEDKLKD